MNLHGIQTGKKSVIILLDFFSKGMHHLYISGYDARKHKTVYFEREYIPVKEGKQRVEITLPVSPDVLNIDIKGDGYELTGITTALMPDTKAQFDEDTKGFFEFVESFGQNMHYEPTGFLYASEGDKYGINWDGIVIDAADGKLATPIRVDHGNGHMEAAANKLEKYTLSMFVTVCLHERTHYKYNTKDETFCDLQAARLAWLRGYMSTEILKAFTEAFDDTPENIKRINAIDNYLRTLNQTNGRF